MQPNRKQWFPLAKTKKSKVKRRDCKIGAITEDPEPSIVQYIRTLNIGLHVVGPGTSCTESRSEKGALEIENICLVRK